MTKKSMVIIMTLNIFGIAWTRALTATFKPLFLLMILRGLATLRSLKNLRLSGRGVIERTENTTIRKSRIFQKFLR